MANAQYTGPNALSETEGYGNLAQKYGKAKSYLDNTATDQGRYALLGDLYKKPNYSGGMKTLDQTILQADPNSRNQLQGIRDKYAGIENDVSTAGQNAQKLVQDRIAASNQLRAETANIANSQWGSLQNKLENQVGASNASRQAAYGRYLADQINSEQAKSEAFSNDEIADAVRKASTQGANVKNAAQVANDQQIAQYNALAQLLGRNDRLSSQDSESVYNIASDWTKYLPDGGSVSGGGQARTGTASSGGYAEQQRRKAEDSAIGKAVNNINPIKKKRYF
jgi:hypothetical protein